MPLFQVIKRSERTAAVSRDPNHFFPHADTLIPRATKGRHTSAGLRRNSPFSIMIDTFTLGLTNSLFLADLTIRFGLSLRVIMRKRAPSVSFAWLVLILLIPFAGALIYLLFGENRLGERRANRLIKDRPIIQGMVQRPAKQSGSRLEYDQSWNACPWTGRSWPPPASRPCPATSLN